MTDLDFAKLLQPVACSAQFVEPGYFVWCGSAVEDDAGKWHLYYSRWKKELGFSAWVTHSEIAHAVGDNPCGPFAPHDTALPPRGADFWDGLCTHNPTIHRFGDRYYLYYMGNTGDGVAIQEETGVYSLNWTHRNNQRIGVAVSSHPDGPWERTDHPLIGPTLEFFDALCCGNPSVTRSFEGDYLMVYKGVGKERPLPFGGPVVHLVATSHSPAGPFSKHPQPVFLKQDVAFAAEDPFIWTQDRRYWAIVKDMGGHFTRAGRSLALFSSANGLDWEQAPHPLVSETSIEWQDGTVQLLEALERPQLAFRAGVPIALLCAAQTKTGETFNVQIPLGISPPAESFLD